MRAREAAYIALGKIIDTGAYANICVSSMLRSGKIDERDRNLFVELVYGSVKAQGTLDWLIENYAVDAKKIDRDIRNILRLGYYQLFYMNKIPESAACNEAVELAKKYSNGGAAKFVNALMRSAVRNPNKAIWPEREKDAIGFVALKYFHPRWLVRRWIEQFGFDNTVKMCELNNRAPELSLRVNTLKTTIDRVISDIESMGCSVRRSVWSPDGIIVSGHADLDRFLPLKNGEVEVQDESSQLAAHILAPQPGEIVIDCCAAPGGKSLHMAALMRNQGKILACDVFEHKLQLIRENSKLCATTIVEPMLKDAREIGKLFAGLADKVLVDAPCSGLGVLRRKADLRWKKTAQQLAGLRDLQAAILNSAGEAVKPGGVLVYSTCTTERLENEDIVTAFLANNLHYSLLNANERLPLKKNGDAMINMRPYIEGTDGFFIAAMKRDK